MPVDDCRRPWEFFGRHDEVTHRLDHWLDQRVREVEDYDLLSPERFHFPKIFSYFRHLRVSADDASLLTLTVRL